MPTNWGLISQKNVSWQEVSVAFWRSKLLELLPSSTIYAKSSIAFKMSIIRRLLALVLFILRIVSWMLHVAIYLFIDLLCILATSSDSQLTQKKKQQLDDGKLAWAIVTDICRYRYRYIDTDTKNSVRLFSHFHSQSVCQRCWQFCSQLALIECEHKNIFVNCRQSMVGGGVACGMWHVAWGMMTSWEGGRREVRLLMFCLHSAAVGCCYRKCAAQYANWFAEQFIWKCVA